jgi:hypothetical protein
MNIEKGRLEGDHFSDVSDESPANALPLRIGMRSQDIEEPISLFIRPNLFLHLRLSRLPNPIPLPISANRPSTTRKGVSEAQYVNA